MAPSVAVRVSLADRGLRRSNHIGGERSGCSQPFPHPTCPTFAIDVCARCSLKIPPKPAKPTSIIAQLAGSGTPKGAWSAVRKTPGPT